MSVVTGLLDWLQSLPPAGVITGAGLLVLGECTIGLGFIAPGETGLLVLGTIADDPPTFLLMWTVTTLCAIAGDAIGYAIGRRYGPRLRQSRIVRTHGARNWDRAADLLHRRGTLAVLVAIFLPVLRTLVPAAAGASRLPLRKFLLAVAVGAAAWCSLHIGIGATAGATARRIEEAVGIGSWLLLGAVVVIAVGVTFIRRWAARSPDT